MTPKLPAHPSTHQLHWSQLPQHQYFGKLLRTEAPISSQCLPTPTAPRGIFNNRLPVGSCESRPPAHLNACQLSWTQVVSTAPDFHHSPKNPSIYLTLVPDHSSSPRRLLQTQAIPVAPGSRWAPSNPGPWVTSAPPTPMATGSSHSSRQLSWIQALREPLQTQTPSTPRHWPGLTTPVAQ